MATALHGRAARLPPVGGRRTGSDRVRVDRVRGAAGLDRRPANRVAPAGHRHLGRGGAGGRGPRRADRVVGRPHGGRTGTLGRVPVRRRTRRAVGPGPPELGS